MSKDLWFAEMERIQAELEDAGVPPDVAYERASERAHGALLERLADVADAERKRRKEEGRRAATTRPASTAAASKPARTASPSRCGDQQATATLKPSSAARRTRRRRSPA